MDFLKKRKRKSVLQGCLLALIPLMLALLMMAGAEVQWLLQSPRYLYEVPEEELEGAYVTVEVPFLYGAYAYEEEYENNRPTGRTVSMEYMIDANEVSYCGMYVSGSNLKKAEALMEESEAYMDGELTDIPQNSFTVTGVMKPMSGESLRFYKEALDYDAMTAEEQALFLTLYLDTEAGVNWGLLAFGVIALVIAVWVIVYAALGKYQKQLAEKANALSGGNPEYILEQVKAIRETTPVCKGVWIGTNLVYLEQGMRQYLYEKREICWAYPQTTRQKIYGLITIGKYHSLVLRTMDGKNFAFRMSEEKTREGVQTLGKLLPACVLGYSKELETIYNQNRGQFAQIAAAQRGAQQ